MSSYLLIFDIIFFVSNGGTHSPKHLLINNSETFSGSFQFLGSEDNSINSKGVNTLESENCPFF